MADWHYESNGKPIGPIAEAQMRAWVADGSVRPSQPVRREGETYWRAARSCAELAAPTGSPGATAVAAEDRLPEIRTAVELDPAAGKDFLVVAGPQMVKPGTREPDSATATKVNLACFQKGLLMFAPAGIAGECLKIAPPQTIPEAGLLPLANNGGAQATCALLPGSVAIDHGSNPLGLLWDARGPGYKRAYAPRPLPQLPDMGAYEYGAVPATPGSLILVR